MPRPKKNRSQPAKLKRKRLTVKREAENRHPHKTMYSRRLIRHQELNWVYREIHECAEKCVSLIGNYTNFFDHFVIDCTARSAAQILRNKSIFVPDRVLREQGYSKKPGFSVAENTMTENCIGFMFYRALKELNKRPSYRAFQATRNKIPFVTAVYLILTESFVRTVKNYSRMCEESVNLRTVIHSPTAQPPKLVRQAIHRLSEVEAVIVSTERKLDADGDILYGVASQVVHYANRIRSYHEHVISAFERLVMQIARRYGRTEQQVEDNFQHGSSGLHKAIYYFDPSREKAFAGIARWWIKAAILAHLKTDANLVKVPSHVWQQHKEYEEIAHDLGVVGDIDKIATGIGHDPEEVEKIYRMINMNRPVSLEAPIGGPVSSDDTSAQIKDSVQDTQLTPEEGIIEAGKIAQYMKVLSPEEKRVVCCLFGLFDAFPDSPIPPTHDEILTEKLCQIATSVRASMTLPATANSHQP